MSEWIRVCAVVALVFAVLGPLGVAAAGGGLAKGDTVYLACNVWYEKPLKIRSTLYQKGLVLPIGTRVEILRKSSKRIKFATDDGRVFAIEWVAKHRPGVSFDRFCERLFTDKPFDELTAGLTKEEVEAIRSGSVEVGMSKRAVLLSVGYPPEIQTPSTEADAWRYWTSRFDTYLVVFKDGKVVQVVD